MPKTSPVSGEKVKAKLMSFTEAVEQLLIGKKVRRKSWDGDNENAYCFINPNGILAVHRQDKNYEWLIHREDAEAQDWVLY